MTNLVELRNVEIYGSIGELRRGIPHLDIPACSKVGIIGGCNSGKTGLALLLAGVATASYARGTVNLDGIQIRDLPPADRARRIAFVPTDPSLVFSGMQATLSGELQLALQILGYGKEATRTIAECINLLSLEPLLDRDPFTLSGGEQVRAALAVTIVKSPKFIILDDVFSALDREACQIVRDALAAAHAAGATVVEFHSYSPSWVESFEECVYLCSDGILQGRYLDLKDKVQESEPNLLPYRSSKLVQSFELEFEAPPNKTSRPAQVFDKTNSITGDADGSTTECDSISTNSLAVREWTFRYSSADFQLGPLSFSVTRGQAVALIGPNGSGKTTLLRTLALLLPPQTGALEIRAADGSIATPPIAKLRHTWATHALYAFQNPDDQIYLPTTWEELTQTARACGRSDFARFAKDTASKLALSDMLERSPMDLPRPLRRLITLGACFVARPPVLLLDEPTAGLDLDQKRKVASILREYLDGGGAALLVSHDHSFILDTCQSALKIREGALSEQISL